MIRWQNIHEEGCAVTRERRDLLSDLAARPDDEALLGAVAEYDGNGDQEVENCDCGRVPFHEMLVHLNVSVPATDDRTSDEIGEAIAAALEVGSDDDSVRDLGVCVSLTDVV